MPTYAHTIANWPAGEYDMQCSPGILADIYHVYVKVAATKGFFPQCIFI